MGRKGPSRVVADAIKKIAKSRGVPHRMITATRMRQRVPTRPRIIASTALSPKVRARVGESTDAMVKRFIKGGKTGRVSKATKKHHARFKDWAK